MAALAGMKRLGTGAVAACAIAFGAAGVAQAADVAPAPAPTPSLDAIGGGEYTFDATLVGEQSAPVVFTFKALKDIKAPGIQAAAKVDSDQFVIVKDECRWAELVAADGDTCSVTVAYTPTAAVADSADLTVVVGPGDQESVLLHGAIKAPAVVEPTPTPEPTPAPVVAEAAPAVIAPAIVAPVVAVKPATAAKTATCVKASSKKLVCTVKLGLAKTRKVNASLMKGKVVKATASRKGDGKITLKSSKKLSAKSYTLKLTVAGKTAMSTGVKLG